MLRRLGDYPLRWVTEVINWFRFLHIVRAHTSCQPSVFLALLVLLICFFHNITRLIKSTVVPNMHLGMTWIIGIRARSCLELKLHKHFHRSYLTYACSNTLEIPTTQADTSFDVRKDGWRSRQYTCNWWDRATHRKRTGSLVNRNVRPV